MNWEAIGAVGELVGATAVVVTLIYLAAQTKSNTAAVNRAATQAIISGRGEASRFLAGDEIITELLWRGAKVTPKDQSLFSGAHVYPSGRPVTQRALAISGTKNDILSAAPLR